MKQSKLHCFRIRTKGELDVSQLGHHHGHIMLDEENKARPTGCHAC